MLGGCPGTKQSGIPGPRVGYMPQVGIHFPKYYRYKDLIQLSVEYMLVLKEKCNTEL